MSTLTGQSPSKVLSSAKDLEGYFQSFAKPISKRRVGLEAEFFAVDETTGQALPYEGERGIHAILACLAKEFRYTPVKEGPHIIALSRGDNFVSLEPGGQIELSAPPVKNVFDIECQLQAFIKELNSARKQFSKIRFLAVGIQPFSALSDIPWSVPKERYAILAEHAIQHGKLSHEMMKLTATNQINLDYTSEANAMEMLRVSLGITSIVSALFANSSFSGGRPNGFMTRRLEIWNHTSRDRSGFIVGFTNLGKTFKDYLDTILDMPLIFLFRKDKWIRVKNLSFRAFIKNGFEGDLATLADFELHLSSAFPEVRIKTYIEIRGMDGQFPQLIPAVAAFWKGILYDEEARGRAWDLVSYATETERVSLHLAVPREGLKAKLGTKPILPLARELVEIACESLARQRPADEKRNECIFLGRIREEIAKPGKSPAEALLEKWERDFKLDPRPLIDYLSILL